MNIKHHFPILIILSILLTGQLQGNIIDVPEDHETIQGGIDASEDGDTVLVQPGTYEVNIDFDGHEIVVGSLFITTGEEAYIDSTIIDGRDSSNVVRFDNEEGENTTTYYFYFKNDWKEQFIL